MSMRRKSIILILLSAPLLVPSVFADNNGDPVVRILKQMSSAVRELNYRGFFTYEVGGGLDTYRIVHRVEDGIEHERLRRLNGGEREIVRSGNAVDCLSRGDQLLRGILRSADKSSRLHDNYHFYLTGDERVADRIATVLHIVPKDQHRFGYTLAVDRKTGLPLKIMRVNTDRRVMERIQFIELRVGERSDDDDAELSAFDKSDASPRTCSAERDVDNPGQRWTVGWMPAGFIPAGEREIDNGDYMLTFTDGLATFSVFISPPNSRILVEGRAQIGASMAYMNQLVWNQAAHSVTVVGEIPFATAERVVAELAPLP